MTHGLTHRIGLVRLLILGLSVAACSPTAEASPTPGATGEPAPDRRPIIIDSDFDQSDIAAIAVLLRDPKVDVRGIAIDGTGLVHCQGGRLVARYLLDEFGQPDIPFGCGREAGGPDATPFPEDWRALADRGYGLDITPRAEAGVPRDAVEVIRTAVDDSPSAPTIVTLGPLTNLEDAFAADPTLPDRIAGIHAMLGTIAAPGNVFVAGHSASDPLEWNAFADPSAVEAVFATDVPIDLVPLDATDDVPVPADLSDRLATDHTAVGADLTYELLLRNPGRLDANQGQQLWDELAALSLSDQDLVTWSDADVLVGDGGRLTQDAAGRPVRYAAAADRPAVEDALLAALRRGGPRATPFSLAGTIDVIWDGTTCAATVDGGGPGMYTVGYTGTAGAPSGVLVGGVRPPHAWSELIAFISNVNLSSEPTVPDWIVEGGQANDEAGAGERVQTTAVLDALTYGPVCVRGTWPDLIFTPGAPFDIGG
jgi:inosine-uridine nucleoside N-ribohydrolase